MVFLCQIVTCGPILWEYNVGKSISPTFYTHLFRTKANCALSLGMFQLRNFWCKISYEKCASKMLMNLNLNLSQIRGQKICQICVPFAFCHSPQKASKFSSKKSLAKNTGRKVTRKKLREYVYEIDSCTWFGFASLLGVCRIDSRAQFCSSLPLVSILFGSKAVKSIEKVIVKVHVVFKVMK